jgi:large subunit ribosomal protein L18
MIDKKQKRNIRHKRIRAKIIGTAKILRFCIFRSNKHIYAQLIDDEKGKTIISTKDTEIKLKVKTPKLKVAYEVGKLIAKKASEKKIEKVIFDRAGYKYHGRIKSLAEGAREAGLKF